MNWAMFAGTPLAFTLGLIGLIQRTHRRMLAVIDLTLSALLAALILFMALGL